MAGPAPGRGRVEDRLPSSRARVLLALALVVGCAVVLGAVAVAGASAAHEDLEALQRERVVPLARLQAVSEMYGVQIGWTAHGIEYGALPWDEGRRRVRGARITIDESWQAYRGTRRTANELRRVEELEPLLRRADGAIEELTRALEQEDGEQVAALMHSSLPPLLLPVIDGLRRLIDEEVAAAEEARGRASRRQARLRLVTAAGLGVGVLATILLAILTARFLRELERRHAELERAQAAFVKRERLAVLGELAASVAHEVRNPLGAMVNSLGALRQTIPPTGQPAQLLDVLDEEVERLGRLVRDLLDFARPYEPVLRSMPLGSVVEGAVAAVRRASTAPGPQIVVDEPGGASTALVDPLMLEQAFTNLLQNAAQASAPGGSVRVRIAEEVRAGKRFGRVEFADDGPGIPREHLELIFQPFFTTRATGTGLGLSVVKRIVDAHDGEISVRSGSGEGTIFTVCVPAGAAAEPEPSRSGSPSLPGASAASGGGGP